MNDVMHRLLLMYLPTGLMVKGREMRAPPVLQRGLKHFAFFCCGIHLLMNCSYAGVRQSRRQFPGEGQAEYTGADKGRCLRHIYERNGGTVIVPQSDVNYCCWVLPHVMKLSVYKSNRHSCSHLLYVLCMAGSLLCFST